MISVCGKECINVGQQLFNILVTVMALAVSNEVQDLAKGISWKKILILMKYLVTHSSSPHLSLHFLIFFFRYSSQFEKT